MTIVIVHEDVVEENIVDDVVVSVIATGVKGGEKTVGVEDEMIVVKEEIGIKENVTKEDAIRAHEKKK